MERTCDCCPNPAVVHEIVVKDGLKAEVHLCAEHAQERGFILPTAHGPTLITGKLLAQARAAAPKQPKACGSCGMTMGQVRETGLVGCPLCYRSFESELGAIIERAQAGACAHVGRHPLHAADLVDRAALRNRLARELREAVSREEYERAARLRDRLFEIGGGENGAADDESGGAVSTANDGRSPSGGGPS
ncbi:MAG: UvrB/UvrC motif-containing protein [bacterium]|jgi:protein arginine kinase activator